MRRHRSGALTGDQWLLVLDMLLIWSSVVIGLVVLLFAPDSLVNVVIPLVSLGITLLGNLAAKPSFPVSMMPVGTPGATGEAGEAGASGEAGEAGATGATGATGKTGKAGGAGVAGVDVLRPGDIVKLEAAPTDTAPPGEPPL